MSIDINALIDLNLNELSSGKDIRKLELKQSNNTMLSNQISTDVFHKMISEDLIYTDRYNKLFLTVRGMDIMSSGGWLQYLKTEAEKRDIVNRQNEERSSLEILNLKLQNENLVFAASIRDKEEEIRILTVRNLKNTILYSGISAVIGALITLIITNLAS